MSETIPSNESSESLPSEEQIFEAVSDICEGRVFEETNRREQGGKLRSLEIRLGEPNAEGLVMQLEYSVTKKGVATVDVAYFDPAVGFDYRSYDPMDIVPGKRLGRFDAGIWVSEDPLFTPTANAEDVSEQSDGGSL